MKATVRHSFFRIGWAYIIPTRSANCSVSPCILIKAVFNVTLPAQNPDLNPSFLSIDFSKNRECIPPSLPRYHYHYRPRRLRNHRKWPCLRQHLPLLLWLWYLRHYLFFARGRVCVISWLCIGEKRDFYPFADRMAMLAAFLFGWQVPRTFIGTHLIFNRQWDIRWTILWTLDPSNCQSKHQPYRDISWIGIS